MVLLLQWGVQTVPQEECLSEKSTGLKQSHPSETKTLLQWGVFGGILEPPPPKELSCKGKLVD